MSHISSERREGRQRVLTWNVFAIKASFSGGYDLCLVALNDCDHFRGPVALVEGVVPAVETWISLRSPGTRI